jgi:hypothetical protein
MLAAYDIFRKQDGALVWIEAVPDLASAKQRLAELSKQNLCEYVIFDQHQQQIVASLNPLNVLTSFNE